MTSNKLKSDQLGMSYGKACHRLRKLVMFRLLQQTSEDVCSRCGSQIKDVDDMSIEHQVPWLHSADPAGLFFDLENVSFSHISCNIGARRSGSKVGRSGYKGVRYAPVSPNLQRKWQARVRQGGHYVFNRYFRTAEAAARAYDQKVIEIRGTGATTNASLGLLTA